MAKRKQPEEEQPEAGAQDAGQPKATAAKSQPSPPAKKAPKDDAAKQLSDCNTYFRRVAEGKKAKATTEEVEQAKEALKQYQSLDTKQQRAEFAARFAETKATKNFGWTRSFKESLTARDTDKETVKANMMTRTLQVARVGVT